MPGSLRTRSPRRRAAAFVAAVLYGVSALALPVVHAQTEDLEAPATVEAGHSQQCDRVHNDISCPASGAFRALAGAAAPPVPIALVGVSSLEPVAADHPPLRPVLAARFVRGPPAA